MTTPNARVRGSCCRAVPSFPCGPTHRRIHKHKILAFLAPWGFMLNRSSPRASGSALRVRRTRSPSRTVCFFSVSHGVGCSPAHHRGSSRAPWLSLSFVSHPPNAEIKPPRPQHGPQRLHLRSFAVICGSNRYLARPKTPTTIALRRNNVLRPRTQQRGTHRFGRLAANVVPRLWRIKSRVRRNHQPPQRPILPRPIRSD
jgi:hypothetical protein